ncbi:CBO0543 family protein [Paenibacillus dendritiformis]|uniref:CBO0543 family protein n=1 Tax=Paenibacillus dendritiformis TaxID=130049 RepID=UPI0030B914DE
MLGTYLDLYFVGKGLYHFPHRLLPEIFSIHIVFTLIGLPILTMVFLYSLSQVNRWGKAGIILFVSLLMPIFEKRAERLRLISPPFSVDGEATNNLFTLCKSIRT